MLYEGKEVAMIARLYGSIQYGQCEFYNSKNKRHKRNAAKNILALIEKYNDEIPKQIRTIIREENRDEIINLKKECEEFLKK